MSTVTTFAPTAVRRRAHADVEQSHQQSAVRDAHLVAVMLENLDLEPRAAVLTATGSIPQNARTECRPETSVIFKTCALHDRPVPRPE